MLDIKLIRSQPEEVKKGLARKGDKVNIDRILELDELKRSHLLETETLKKNRNSESKKIAELKKSGQDASAILEKMSEVADQIKKIDQGLQEINQELDGLLMWVPNLPEEDIPDGGEENNQMVRTWSEPKQVEFTIHPHWDTGKKLDILDIEHTAQIAGSGFVALKGQGARLERALLSFMLDVHTQEHGYLEIAPPHLVNRQTLTGSGQLPKLEEDMYNTKQDDFFLIPTSEVPLTNFHRNEVLPAENLPIYFTAATSCFRREAGAAGKDTRGLLRVHEFKKVELIKIVRAETSSAELDKMLANAETILQRLEIPYRVVLLATGDMSFSSQRTYDLEIWAPGVDRWLEVSSCSNCGEFQARRANIRCKEKGGKPEFVHILNGSGVAVPRLMVAIIENYQRADGHIDIPKALQPYMSGATSI